jgi:hypothetical protein
MAEEFRLAFVAGRDHVLSFSPDTAYSWLANGWDLVPEARNDVVTWNYDHMDSAWHLAFTPGTRPLDVVIEGRQIVKDAQPVTFDLEEIRRKAAEQAVRLHERLAA